LTPSIAAGERGGQRCSIHLEVGRHKQFKGGFASNARFFLPPAAARTGLYFFAQGHE
jgi:hypothetical protein